MSLSLELANIKKTSEFIERPWAYRQTDRQTVQQKGLLWKFWVRQRNGRL